MGRVIVYLKHCSKHRDELVTLCIVDHRPTSGQTMEAVLILKGSFILPNWINTDLYNVIFTLFNLFWLAKYREGTIVPPPPPAMPLFLRS